MPARSRTPISVASPRITTGPNSSSSRANRSRPLLDQRHLVAHLEERARDVRADLPPAGDDDVHQAALRAGGVAGAHGVESDEIAVCVGQTVRMPAIGVELGARRVEDADDDAASIS